MTYDGPRRTVIQPHVLAVACPQCKAPAGDFCFASDRKRRRKSAHVLRVKAGAVAVEASERAMFDVCPDCGARSGAPCTSFNNNEPRSPHLGRRLARFVTESRHA